MVIIRTTFGEIKFELDAEKAPKTVANFLKYARDGFYDGTIFHRVIDNFHDPGRRFRRRHEQKRPGEPIETRPITASRTTSAPSPWPAPWTPTPQRPVFHQRKGQRFPQSLGKNMQGWGYTVFGKVTEGIRSAGQDPSCAHRLCGWPSGCPCRPGYH